MFSFFFWSGVFGPVLLRVGGPVFSLALWRMAVWPPTSSVAKRALVPEEEEEEKGPEQSCST